MRETEKTARDIIVHHMPKPIRRRKDDARTETQFYDEARDQYEFSIERATDALAFALTNDRAEVRRETNEACAKVAESEFAGDEKWDRPIYSANGSGKWIATAIRSLLTRSVKTNNPPRRGGKKEEKDDDRRTEGRGLIPGAGRSNSQKT